MRIYEANYATRIYLCNPCKPCNRPTQPSELFNPAATVENQPTPDQPRICWLGLQTRKKPAKPDHEQGGPPRSRAVGV